ncbi:hypothetical protein [Amaricoccus solimangrovi]|uniref:Uncharacterized protein n=1 Tax=Amaricoccus solimangrovi TaxID=2589815 RepID=A0A501WZG6_9RHOB|nr:hypothetical protein [Amaricoccus solimangrovi]TPE51506.1 hypothetical protein FJM51_09755 [Amaricoccus solimangrovi]
MSDSNSDGSVAALVLGLCCLVVVGFGAWTAGFLSDHRVQTERTTRYAERTDEYIGRTCVGMDRAALLQCATEAIESSREDQRAEYNLNAQESMARWTFWLLGLSVITTGVAGGGIYYVHATLTETRAAVRAAEAANEVSRDVGQAQIRAYLSLTPGLPSGVKIDDFPSVQIFVENTGQSPAYSVLCASAIVPRNWYFDGNENFLVMTSFDKAPFQTPEALGTIGANGRSPTEAKCILLLDRSLYDKCFDRGDDAMFLAAIVTYVDVFGASHETRFCARMDDPVRGGGAIGNPETGQCRWTQTRFHNTAT